jgi:hypothetical protein
MKRVFKKLILSASPILDVLAAPLVLVGALFFKVIRRFGVARLSLCRRIFWAVGVMPVTNHYYDPFFRKKDLKRSLREDRYLPGINLNSQGQLDLLKCFKYNEELVRLPRQPGPALEFYYDNVAFLSGDAEFLYNVVRHFKPQRLIEVGSGFSSLMALKAMEANREEDRSYRGEMICIEPFEHRWLEELNVSVRRQLVQMMDIDFFRSLKENDILFIDSSHITKPQNDVLFLYLQVLPVLNPGVLVHVHDIFTPKDYLEQWILEDVRFWNEQYLLEAFLSLNGRFEVIGALNFLMHKYPDELLSVCPVLGEQMPHREPGSFWLRRVN